MQTILVIVAILYAVVGLGIYFMTMNKSDTLQHTVESHSPVNTYIFTHKWLWLMIVCLWPIWLLIQDKLPDQGKKGPF